MLEFTPAIVGGLLIGLSASLMMLLYGRIAGISGMIQNLITSEHPTRYASGAFLLGLLLGTALTSLLADINSAPLKMNPLMIVIAGLLVGYGTRLGSGCTSGHGICGISRLSLRSTVATLTFMASGILTVYTVRHLI
jgi:uncharacterized membrane protein YedE/YeeE